MKEKKRIDPIDVEKKYDFFIVIENGSKPHNVYMHDYDTMVELVKEIDETKYPNGIIPPYVLADKICKRYPGLNTKMFRPTGPYYVLYYLVLKILDHYRYIDYYKDGTIKKHEKLIEITPIKRGLTKWVPELARGAKQ